jgi:integrase
MINNWRTLGKAATKDPVYYSPEFKKLSEQTPDVYLTEKELEDIIDLTLPGRQAIVRDWFILDCYTGLRVSDLVLLEKKNITGKMITISNEKTGARVVIPIHRAVQAILTRYKGFPPKVTDVEINKTIKAIARKAGITSPFLYTVTKGGRREDHYFQKWEMVSCHTSRRSFITNLLKSGVSESLVMSMTGLKSHKTLSLYNKMTPEDAARAAQGMKFFR